MNEDKYEKIENKLRKKKRKKQHMHQSGKSVFKLAELITKAKKKS